MKVLGIIALIVVVVALVVGYKFSRFGVETPEYEIVQKVGAFEVRDYPTLVVVSTPMENPDPDEGTSFMRLFRYISGNNSNEQKIAMTTPVITSRENGSRQMSFIVPREVAEKGVPTGANEQVEIDTMAAGRYAVYRFSGAWDVAQFEEAKSKLAAWVSEQGLTPRSEPMIANYDPPYTPSFLRRNEILMRL